MHLTYNIALIIHHINNITTIMQKATTTQDIRGSPQCGDAYTNSSLSLLSYFNLLQAQSHMNPLRIGQEIHAQLARSSFPELGLSTKPSYNILQAKSHKNPLRIGQEIYAHLARSSFPKPGSSTNPSYNHLHLAMQVLNTICMKNPQLFALSSPATLHT
jgi:hypothetical protein